MYSDVLQQGQLQGGLLQGALSLRPLCKHLSCQHLRGLSCCYALNVFAKLTFFLLLSQVAGLDVGWGQRLDLQLDTKSQRYVLECNLPVGKFAYKFIFDDVWTYSADHPTLLDGGNINNYVEVMGNMSNPMINAARVRLLSEEGLMEPKERETIVDWLKTCDV